MSELNQQIFPVLSHKGNEILIFFSINSGRKILKENMNAMYNIINVSIHGFPGNIICENF
jgi:hypothetical protein